jgi:hypothetical protein
MPATWNTISKDISSFRNQGKDYNGVYGVARYGISTYGTGVAGSGIFTNESKDSSTFSNQTKS